MLQNHFSKNHNNHSMSAVNIITSYDVSESKDYNNSIKTRSVSRWSWWSWWNWWFIEIIGVKFNGIFGGVGGGSKSQKKV